MAIYNTIPEAVEICRNTYKGKVYHLFDEVESKGYDGTASEILGTVIMFTLNGKDFSFIPSQSDWEDEATWAFIDTFEAMLNYDESRFNYVWERNARDLCNQIIAEGEE